MPASAHSSLTAGSVKVTTAPTARRPEATIFMNFSKLFISM